MVKPATVNRIRTLSKQGKSSNEIARQLRREGIGIRRQTILNYVREFKGRPPKPQRYKYIPKKYRRPIAPPPTRKYHVSAFGKHDKISKRYEVFASTKKQLHHFLIDGVKHPPKRRIERIDLDRVKGLSQRARHVDYGEYWDERPEIKS